MHAQLDPVLPPGCTETEKAFLYVRRGAVARTVYSGILGCGVLHATGIHPRSSSRCAVRPEPEDFKEKLKRNSQ